MEDIEHKVRMLERSVGVLGELVWGRRIEESDIDLGKKLSILSKLGTAAYAVDETLRLIGYGPLMETYVKDEDDGYPD